MGLLWVLMGPSRSLFVLMDSNGFLRVLIGPDAALLVLLGLYLS